MTNQNLTEISSQTSLSEPSSEDLQICSDLLSFIAGAPSPYHVTASFAGMLDAAGFVFLRETEDWPLVPGGKYYVTRNDSSLIAFCVPQEQPLRFQITAAHSDSPSFRVKTNPYAPCAGQYICLNVEKYGGAILSSWLDRPLSLAGRVMVREDRPVEAFSSDHFAEGHEASASSSDHFAEGHEASASSDHFTEGPETGAFSSDPFTKRLENSVVREDGRCEIRSHLVNLDRDLVLIPNLAIHMNRKINEGYAYQIQKDMLPLFGSLSADGKLEELIARELGCSPDQILGSDLFLYNRTPGSIWGAMNEYISSPKLDDLQCAYSAVRALIETAKQDAAASQSICMAAVFDNEEVGSLTAQGADSTFLEDTLTRIWMSLRPAAAPDPSISLRMALAGSFLISADNAHALHPHHAEKADPTHRPLMNYGPVIKFSANQKYTTDAFSASVFQTICQKAGVPWQVFHNHSDQPGGSTLGNLSNAHVSLHAVDIGLPQLSMHSPYETAGARDTALLLRALEIFYRTDVIIKGDRICFQ